MHSVGALDPAAPLQVLQLDAEGGPGDFEPWLGTARQQPPALSDPLRMRTSAAAHAALRHLLSAATGRGDPASLEFDRGPFGKPMLAGGPFFNLSMRPGVALIALGPDEVGVDVERIPQGLDLAGIAHRFFTLAEQQSLRASGATAQAFARTWSRKEALVKAAGVGLRALSHVCTVESNVWLDDATGRRRRYLVRSLAAPSGHAAALAHAIPGPA